VSGKDKAYNPIILSLLKDFFKHMERYSYTGSVSNSDVKLSKSDYHFVLEKNDEAIGMAICGAGNFEKDTFFISYLYLKQEHRSKGHGSYMLNEIEKFARERRFNRMSLKVDKDNVQALASYERFGFKPQIYIMMKFFR
jgi:ribosomal protein S18 acetylase RimI-like enzyme